MLGLVSWRRSGSRRVVDRVGPVGERARRVGGVERPARAVGVVRLVALEIPHALPVAVQAGVGGQDVVAPYARSAACGCWTAACRCW